MNRSSSLPTMACHTGLYLPWSFSVILEISISFWSIPFSDSESLTSPFSESDSVFIFWDFVDFSFYLILPYFHPYYLWLKGTKFIVISATLLYKQLNTHNSVKNYQVFPNKFNSFYLGLLNIKMKAEDNYVESGRLETSLDSLSKWAPGSTPGLEDAVLRTLGYLSNAGGT